MCLIFVIPSHVTGATSTKDTISIIGGVIHNGIFLNSYQFGRKNNQKPDEEGRVMYLSIFHKDKLLLGALAGALSDIAMNLLEVVFQKTGLIRYTLDQFAGSMFIRDKTELLTFLGGIIGFMAGAALCMILGVVFVYLIYFSGFRAVVVKGLLYGFVLWFLIYGGFKSGMHISYLQDYNSLHIVTSVLVHLVFGLSLGLIVVRVGTSRN